MLLLIALTLAATLWLGAIAIIVAICLASARADRDLQRLAARSALAASARLTSSTGTRRLRAVI
jgi:hypothetical protein